MADAGIDLSIRTDSSQAGAGVREVEEAIRRAGRTSEEASRRSTDATQRNLQLYREETRILDLRARGRNDIADALRAEVDIRRMGIRLERELHVSQEEGLRLARQRLAAERALAEETARRNAAGAGGGPGGGPSPPGGGPGSGGQGGGSGGGGPPPSGGPPPRRGGPPPPGGPDRGRDLNDTYYVLQDLVQGGVGAVANQMPIIARLLGQYGGAIASATVAVGAGVAIGAVIADPQGVKGRLVEFANKLDKTIGAFPTPSSIVDAFGRMIFGVSKIEEQAKEYEKAQERALREYKVRRDQELARRSGDAEGGSARNRAAGQQASRESREAENSHLEDERERRMQLERLRLEGILNVEKKTKALAEFDKKWLTEKADRTLKIARNEFEWASAGHAAAKAELDALERRADKARLAAGASGTSAELEKINAARGGLKEAVQMANNALREAAAARTKGQAGIKTAADEGKIIDQKVSNFEADRAVEAVQQTLEVFGKVSAAVTEFAQEVRKKSKEIDKTRAATNREMEILELRSRGQGRKADRLERQNAISDRAKELREKEGRSPEEAAKMAEREYDLRNPSRRIRGAGFGGPGRRGKNPSRTDFTGIDGVEYTGANGDGGLDVRNYNGLNGNGGLDGQSWSGANGDGGLDALRRLNSRSGNAGRNKQSGPDGLDALQNQNRKIRGAGFKAERQTREAEPKAGQQQAGGGGPLAAILNAISGVGRKVETLTSASRTIRR